MSDRIPPFTYDAELLNTAKGNRFIRAINRNLNHTNTYLADIRKNKGGITYDMGLVEKKIDSMSTSLDISLTFIIELQTIKNELTQKRNQILERLAAAKAERDTIQERMVCLEELICGDSGCTLDPINERTYDFCRCGFTEFSSPDPEILFYKTLTVSGERLISVSVETNVAATNCTPSPNTYITGSGTNLQDGAQAGTTTGRVGITALVKWYVNCTYSSSGSGTLIYSRNIVEETALTLTQIGVGPSLQDITCTRSLQLQQQTTPGGSWGNVSNAALATGTITNSNNFTSTVTANRTLSTGTFTISSTAGRLLRWRTTLLSTGSSTQEFFSDTFEPGESPNGPLGDLITYTKEVWTGSLTAEPNLDGSGIFTSCGMSGTVNKQVLLCTKHCECPADDTETLVSTENFTGTTDAELLYEAIRDTWTGTARTERTLDGTIGQSCLSDADGVVATLSVPETLSDVLSTAPYTDRTPTSGAPAEAKVEFDDGTQRCGTASRIIYTVDYVGPGDDVEVTLNKINLDTTVSEPLVITYSFIGADTTDDTVEPEFGYNIVLADAGCEIVIP